MDVQPIVQKLWNSQQIVRNNIGFSVTLCCFFWEELSLECCCFWLPNGSQIEKPSLELLINHSLKNNNYNQFRILL